MKQPSQTRQQQLQTDKERVMVLYGEACSRWGKSSVDADLRYLWTLRCMCGMSGQLPFDGGMVARTLGELLWVAKRVCNLAGEQRS